MNKKYWEKRILAAEEQATARGVELIHELQALYVKSYQQIIHEVEKLAATATLDGAGATEVWQYERAVELEKILAKNIELMSAEMTSKTADTLTTVYTTTQESMAQIFGKEFVSPNEFQVKAVLNEVYYGNNYSGRIWKHNAALGGRIKSDMERMIVTGQNPQSIAKKLQLDYNVAYNNAERLIRTEASRIYAQATEDSYKQYGIKENEFLAEPGACKVCSGHDKKTYQVGNGPTLPVHPRCRCVYLPVIE